MYNIVLNQEKTKKCSKCKVTKNLSEFSKDKSKKDGLTSACKECNNNREKKRRVNGGDFTKEQKRATLKKFGSICQICSSNSNLEVDHKLPQNICESNKASVEENSWVLCKACNIAKGTRILFEVIKEVPRKTLGPMLMQQFSKRIAEGFFEKVTITIGGKQFTEVKLK